MDGIVNFLKPTGISSSQAVGIVKRQLGRRDVGHLGTLDPYAAGVLPIAVGKATRLFDLFLTKKKSYRAFIRFGYESDTLDSSGVVVGTQVDPDYDMVAQACAAMRGTYMQTPPKYSAKSVGGVRAYELARKNIDFTLAQKQVTIEDCTLLWKTEDGVYVLDVTCSAGTYIRSLVVDLAARLNTCAVMTGLIRLASGPWTIDQSYTEDELRTLKERTITDTATVLQDYPKVVVDDKYYKEVSNGVPVEVDCVPPTGGFTLWCKRELFGLGGLRDGKVVTAVYLHV